MDYKYNISGITCDNCVKKITQLLQNKLKAQKLKFSHNNSQVEFTSTIDTNSKELNILFSTIGNYKVSDEISPNLATAIIDSPENVSYKPIYLLFAYLLIVNILIILKNFQIEDFMVNFMASFFLVFSFFKMLDLKGFAEGYSSYDIVAKRFFTYGYIYPFIELGFGIAYLLIGKNLYLNITVFIVMLISSIGVIKAKLSKQNFYCACVGTFLKVPLGNIAIIEDITMMLMSLFMIIQLM